VSCTVRFAGVVERREMASGSGVRHAVGREKTGDGTDRAAARRAEPGSAFGEYAVAVAAGLLGTVSR
jgi:hypothetical protein